MKPPILIIAATLLAWPAIGQAPIDPPVASLPVPSVAVESLAAAPSRPLARKLTDHILLVFLLTCDL